MEYTVTTSRVIKDTRGVEPSLIGKHFVIVKDQEGMSLHGIGDDEEQAKQDAISKFKTQG